jgi:hypothetical protein
MTTSDDALRQLNKQRQKRPTESEALALTQRLVTQWTSPKADEYIDAAAEVLQSFSLEIAEKCVSPIHGIARTKVDGQARRYPPSIPEIISFCESTVRGDYRPPSPKVEPPRGPASAGDRARVAAKAKDVLASLARAQGKRMVGDLRAEAEAKLTIAALGILQEFREYSRTRLGDGEKILNRFRDAAQLAGWSPEEIARRLDEIDLGEKADEQPSGDR